jgi:hypothetical protein
MIERPDWVDDALCASPEGRALVDATYERPGHHHPHTEDLAYLCSRCPVRAPCLEAGMRGEPGMWGGTTPKDRTKAGAPPWRRHLMSVTPQTTP